jgi:hypothetical protein
MTADLTKAERVALSLFLTEYPDNWTFGEILKALDPDNLSDDWEQITIWQPLADDYGLLIDTLQDTRDTLTRIYGEWTMLLNTLTLAERERLAYAEGFTTTAALLAQASDDAIDLEAAQDAAMDAEMDWEKLEKDQERRIAILDNDLGRMEDRLNNMAAFVQLAADYLKAGDVDRAGCTLSEALKWPQF